MVSRRAFFAGSALPILYGQQMFGNAEAYDRFMGRWSRLIAPLFVEFARVPSTGKVLDVGSGTGALAFEIARSKTGVHVTGIDPSNEYVAYAASRNAFPERARFEIGDGQNLHFTDSAFAASVSLLVFNFIPDPGKALREIRRVTRPGGGISAAVWDYGERMLMLRAFWDAVVSINAAAEKLDEKHMPLCRAGELSKLWTQGGLKNVHEQPLETTLRFDSFADYWNPFLLGQGPAGAYLRSAQNDAVQAIRNAVKRRLSVSSETDTFSLPARVWAVRGTVPN